MKFLFVITAFIAILLFAALLITLFRARRGRETHVREYYAFKCSSLLIALAADTIIAIVAPYSLWDFLADFFQFSAAEPPLLSLAGKVLAFLVFLACCYMVRSTYRHWTGPVSRHQYRQNRSQFENGSILQDSYLALASFLEKNNDLNVYKNLSDTGEYQENPEADKIPWHMEFARIYTLMSNQAEIHPQNDWHAQQHCYISTYSQSHKIAIYCSDTLPDKNELTAFLSYIFRLHDNYLHIIAAVKEGDCEDYTESLDRVKIEYIFKQNALSRLVDFSEYFRNIELLYRQPLMNTSLKIEDIYVEPCCRFENGGGEFFLHSYVSDWLKEDSNRQLALLGDFGQGKTLFSIYLTWQMIREKGTRIPILIPLRNKSPRNSTPAEILSYFAIPYGINPEALLILNRNGRLLLIFDGFDEMDLIGNDDIRKRHFKSLWGLAVPGSKIFLTGRPNYFLSPDEMKSALGLQAGSAQLPFCQGLFLLPFNQEQIMRALRSAGMSVRSGIERIITEKSSSSFLDLISRPSHLFLVGLIWETRELEKKYKNLTSAAIINEFLQNSFERQSDKGQRDPYFYLTPVEREYFMIGVASKMYKQGITVITHEAFHDAVIDLADLFPERLSAGNPVFLNIRNGKSVKEFARSDDNSLLAIINDVRTCGILVNDYANNGLMFSHKSFYDFLVAKFYMGRHLRLHDNNMLISDTLSKSSPFHPPLKNDATVRKLLAELISSEICRLAPDKMDETIRCRKIFEQCQKVIGRFFFYRTPKGLLRSCLKNRRALLYFSLGAQRKFSAPTYRQKQKFLALLTAVFFALCIYLAKIISISLLPEDTPPPSETSSSQSETYYTLNPSLEWFSLIGSTLVEASAVTSPKTAAPPYPPLLNNHTFYFLMLSVLFLIYWGNTQLKKKPDNKADIILLTWYYACMENHVPEDVVYRCFPGKYADMFTDYLAESSLNPLADKSRPAKIPPQASEHQT